MKTLLQLAAETVLPDGGTPSENQENEIAALVQFGERVLLECSPTNREVDGAGQCTCLPRVPDLKNGVCSECGFPRH